MFRIAGALLLTLSLTACASDGGPMPGPLTAPSPSPSPSPTLPPSIPDSLKNRVLVGELTVSGSVTDAVTGRELGGNAVNVWVQQWNGFDYSYWWARGSVYSDTGGRFLLTQLPQLVTVSIHVIRTGYVQQCAHAPITMGADETVNVRLVPVSRLSSSMSYTNDAPGLRTVTGTVYEATSEGRQPVAGVYVNYDVGLDSPAANTVTDGDGRYLLCGIPANRSAAINAHDTRGRSAFSLVPPGGTASDFELRRP